MIASFMSPDRAERREKVEKVVIIDWLKTCQQILTAIRRHRVLHSHPVRRTTEERKTKCTSQAAQQLHMRPIDCNCVNELR